MKKGIKRHLMEIFLKQEFLELSDKEKQELSLKDGQTEF